MKDGARERTYVLLHGCNDITQCFIQRMEFSSDFSCIAQPFHIPETSPGLQSLEIINRSLTI